MEPHPVVTRTEWLAARRALLAREKELTRLTDQLSAAQRALPWVRIEKPYVFDGPGGKCTLGDLFRDRSGPAGLTGVPSWLTSWNEPVVADPVLVVGNSGPVLTTAPT